jgi:hypothetical protein
MTFKFALKTAAIATALAFATASHAADTYKNVISNPDAELYVAFGGSLITPAGSQQSTGVPVFSMEGTDGSGTQPAYLAFCIQPDVALLGHTTYTRNTAFDFSAKFGAKANLVQALYETSYVSLYNGVAGSALSTTQLREAFQLALWDASYDNADLFSGTQYFVAGAPFADDARVAAAQSMLLAAQANENHLTNKYSFISFTGTAKVGDATVASQELMSISAVPESETWAMLATGLGLIGFMGRRRSNKKEQFAA